MKKYEVKAPEGVTSWDRIRFKANEEDFRSIIWPPLGPYWCSGYGEGYSIVVAYVPHGTSETKLKEYWPEMRDLNRMQENVPIIFYDRFPKPDWWVE